MPAVDDAARWTAHAGAWLVPTHAVDAAAFLITKVNGAAGLTATHQTPRLPVSGVRNAPVETPHWDSATRTRQAVTGSLVVPTVSSPHHTAAARPRRLMVGVSRRHGVEPDRPKALEETRVETATWDLLFGVPLGTIYRTSVGAPQ